MNKTHLKMMRATSLMLFLSSLLSYSALAEILVVVHQDSKVGDIEVEELQKVFLGKTKSLGGVKVKLVDQRKDSSIRSEFYDLLLGKSVNEVMGIWSKIVFTGRGQFPYEANSDEEVLKFVQQNINAVGYISESSAVKDVKIIFKI